MKPFTINDKLYNDEALEELHKRGTTIRDSIEKIDGKVPRWSAIQTLDELLAVLAHFVTNMEDPQ